MGKFVAAGALALVIIFSALALWLSIGAKSCLEPGPLNSQMDRLIKLWGDLRTEQSFRSVDIVIDDSIAPTQPDFRRGTGEVEVTDPDAELLPAANGPSFFQNIQRIFFRKSASAEENTDFIKNFNGRQNTIVWTHKGRESISESEMAREIRRVILKAYQAGAEINIVTKGFSAAPALEAISSFAASNDAQVPVVNKLVALDMNITTLRGINPGFFSKFRRPRNLTEWVNIWNNPSAPKIWFVELHSAQADGKRFSSGELFTPFIIRRGISDHDISNMVMNLIQRGFSFKQVIDYLLQFVDARKKEEEAQEKLRQAQAAVDETQGENQPRKFSMRVIDQPLNPLDAISLGTEKKEQAKPEEEITIKEMPWSSALSYCKKNGKRLPNLKELKAIWKKECSRDMNPNLCNGWFWSSQEAKGQNAWYLAFSSGRSGNCPRTASHYVWCVP